jgi:hypothetical protein
MSMFYFVLIPAVVRSRALPCRVALGQDYA